MERDDVREIVTGILPYLGPGWHEVERDFGYPINITDDALSAYINDERGSKGTRLVIRGWLPGELHEYKALDDKLPGITVAIGRGPEAIAREMVRRLLPNLAGITERARHRMANAKAFESREFMAIKRLAERAGVKMRDNAHRDARPHVDTTWQETSEVYRSLKIERYRESGASKEPTVEISIEAPIPLAERIIDLIAAEQKSGRE